MRRECARKGTTMVRRPFGRRLLGVLAMLAAMLVAAPAAALTLDEARAQGLVGEQPDGYVGIVQDGPGVRDLVSTVNAQRRAHYQGIAQQNGVPIQAVEQQAGQQLIERAGSGVYVLTPSGWQRR